MMKEFWQVKQFLYNTGSWRWMVRV